jgi:ABC-type sulfate transport system permease component
MICIVILVVSLSVIFPYFFMYASDTVTTLINILSHHSVHYSKCNFFAPYKLKTLLISLLGMTISYVIVRKSMCIKDR